ncbi:low molecular weight phosphotyrosine protein phosphatase [Thiotrichales bacterium 19S11-10]|nr:low molecular weight phosphotyrosine protein phosphatase [Thiotrichales bacterium 19S11-10]
MEKISILFVCMGNICRSPTAHGVFRHLVEEKGYSDKFTIESAGTHSRIYHHEGGQPDSRSMATASEHGVDISDLASRQFIAEDFQTYDHIIVMDNKNYEFVIQLAQSESERNKVSSLTSYLPDSQYNEVPDPYLVGDFEGVYNLIYQACEEVLEQLK